jgi:hypothetical protein
MTQLQLQEMQQPQPAQQVMLQQQQQQVDPQLGQQQRRVAKLQVRARHSQQAPGQQQRQAAVANPSFSNSE